MSRPPWKFAFAAPLFVCGVAFADTLPRFELTPYVGYRGGGHYLDAVGEADFESAESYGVVFNIRADYNTQWEILYGRHSPDIDDSAASFDGSKFGVDMDTVQVGGTYVFDGEVIRPFVAVTLGVTFLRPDLGEFSDESYFSGSFGLGARYDISRRVGLRFEARAMGLFGKSNSLVFCDESLGDDFCIFAGDGGVIPQFEGSVGVSFRF